MSNTERVAIDPACKPVGPSPLMAAADLNLPDDVLLRVNHISKRFTSKGVCVRAVSDVSFDVCKGETVGIVGESGCGKTTLGRCIVRAIDASEGDVLYRTSSGSVVNFATLARKPQEKLHVVGWRRWQELHSKYADDRRVMRMIRKEIQMIFQDPYSSLNPRMTVGQIISEGMKAHKMFRKSDDRLQQAVIKVMEDAGLQAYFIHRYPHQFSGGQRQRIGIARSLAVNPKFVVCDEAVSALDVSIQSQIINLLKDLKEQQNLTYLFITHDLSVVKYISDRIGVMYLGNMVELASSKDLFGKPLHPYTEALMNAIPTTDVDSDREIQVLEGDIPSPVNPPKGCKFHTRCKYATEICKHMVPQWEEVEPDHFVACHHYLGKDEETVKVKDSTEAE